MKYEDLGSEVGKLVDEKNTAYGNSFNVAEDFIKLLWPNGVPPEAFNDMLCVVRIFDKLKRIATNKGYGGESPYRDIAGYALLGLMKDQENKPKTWTPAELVEDEVPVKCVGCDETNIYATCPVHSPYPPVNYPLPHAKPKPEKKKNNRKKP